MIMNQAAKLGLGVPGSAEPQLGAYEFAGETPHDSCDSDCDGVLNDAEGKNNGGGGGCMISSLYTDDEPGKLCEIIASVIRICARFFMLP